MNIVTSDSSIVDIKNIYFYFIVICEIGISTSKKLIIDINKRFWMAAYGEI